MPTEDYLNEHYGRDFDFLDEAVADAAEVAGAKKRSCDLGYLTQKVQEMRDLAREVADLEESVQSKKQQLAAISEQDVPNYLMEFGISSLELSDGSKVVVDDVVCCGITKEHRDEAFRWLREHGHDGIIKNDYVVGFGKGQDEEATEFAAKMGELGYSYQRDEHVHWQTLRAWATRLMEAGRLSEVPAEAFSLFQKKVAKVVASKER